MDAHRYESMWVDFVGSILVEREVADLHPNGDPLWSEIGLFVELFTSNLDEAHARAWKTNFGRHLLRQGLGNFHIRLEYAELDENEDLIEHVMWIELVHSSIQGEKLRRIIVVRSEPPFDYRDYE